MLIVNCQTMLSKKELEELLAIPLTVSPETPLAEVISLMNASEQTDILPEEGDRWERAKNLVEK